MTEAFYQLKRRDEELVKSGKITIEELGFRDALAMHVNPSNGYCLSNFSMLAAEWNSKPARVTYVFEKLKSLGLIYYEVCQGKRSKSHFFVMGLEMTKVDGKTRTVTREYIEKVAHYSEVKSLVQKSERFDCIEETATVNAQDLEVAYIEKDIEIEKEREIYSHPLFKLITKEDWSLLKAKYESSWLAGRLEGYAGRLKGDALSADRLSTFLAEDWQKTKPAKDYKLENDECAEKIRIWDEEQKAEENEPLPEAYLKYFGRQNAP